MWLHHFFSLLGTVLSYFFNAIGTTILGWFLDIVFLVVASCLALRALHTQEGWTAVVTHWEKEKKVALKYSLWCACVIYGPVFLSKVGQAVYDDHVGLVQRSTSQRARITSGKAVVGQLALDDGNRYHALEVSCAEERGANGKLESQNRDQQGTINNCQASALSLLKPVPLLMASIPMGNAPIAAWSPESDRLATYLLTINQRIPEVFIHVECLLPIEMIVLDPADPSSAPPPIKREGGAEEILDSRRTEVNIKEPTLRWNPLSPITAKIMYKPFNAQQTGTTCRFTLPTG